MATASLAIRISAQIAEFQKAFAETNKTIVNFEKEFQKTSQQVNKAIADISAAFKSLGTAAGIMGAAIVGIGLAIAAAVAAFKILETAATAAFDFVKGAVTDTAALGEQLFDLSNKVGVSVESLSALRFVAAQTGTSLDTIAGSVFRMSANLGKASKDTTDALKGIGLSLADLQKQAPEQAFASILKSINQLPSASAQAAAGMAIFGRSFKEISQLKGENLDELIKKAKQLGLVMSTETAVAADLLGDTMNELRGQFEGFTLQLGAKLLPAVLTFVRVFGTVFADAFTAATRVLSSTGTGFDAFVTHVGQAAARLIEVFASMLDAAVTWASGTILRAGLVATALLRIAEIQVSAGQAAALLSGNLAVGAALDVLGKKIATLKTDVASLTVTTLTGGAALRTFAREVASGAAAAGDTFGASLQRVQKEIAESADKMRKSLKTIGDSGVEAASKADKAFESLQKKISGQLAVKEAKLWSKALDSIGGDFSRLTKKDASEFLGVLDEITDRFGSLEAAGLSGLRNIQSVLRALTQQGQTLPLPIIPSLGPQTLASIAAANLPPQTKLEIIPTLSQATLNTITGQFTEAITEWKRRFLTFQEDIRDIGFNTARGLAQAVADGIRTGDWATFRANLTDVLANGIGSALAAAVNFVVPGLGTILQPILSALAEKLLGFFGLGTRGRDAVKAFAASFGGFDALREKLRTLGAEGERLWIALTQGVGRNNPAEAKAAIDAITSALDEQEQAWRDIGRVVDAVNKRTEIFGRQFANISDPAKLAEIAQRTQPEFERLGVIVAGVFAEMVRHSGDAIGAIQALAPSFELLKKGVNEFGLTSTVVIDELMANFDLLNNEAFKPLFEQIQASGAILEGLDLARALSPTTFQALAADIGQSIQEIVNRGGDMARTLALSQPILQRLWENQQIFGRITDETTQSILNQAEQQGLVGAHMKDVNEKILDVLIAIADVFGAVIPDVLRGTSQAAQDAASDIEDAFKDIEIPPIDVPFRWDVQTGNLPDFDIPRFGHGGIVTHPTLALVGESGPEAILPLSRSGGMAPGTTLIVEMDGRVLAEAVVPHIPGEVTRIGVGLT